MVLPSTNRSVLAVRYEVLHPTQGKASVQLAMELFGIYF